MNFDNLRLSKNALADRHKQKYFASYDEKLLKKNAFASAFIPVIQLHPLSVLILTVSSYPSVFIGESIRISTALRRLQKHTGRLCVIL